MLFAQAILRRTMKKVWLLYVLFLLTALLVLAPVMYLVSYWLTDLPSSAALTALADQYGQDKQNPLIVSILSCAPFLLLALVLGLARWRGALTRTCRHIVLGGGGAILVVMTWAHAQFWPSYLPGVPYPGFPHGLELVIAPLYFAPVAMLVGAAFAWLAGRDS